MLEIKEKHSSDRRDVLREFVQQGWDSSSPEVFQEQVRQASIQSDVGGVDCDLVRILTADRTQHQLISRDSFSLISMQKRKFCNTEVPFSVRPSQYLFLKCIREGGREGGNMTKRSVCLCL